MAAILADHRGRLAIDGGLASSLTAIVRVDFFHTGCGAGLCLSDRGGFCLSALRRAANSFATLSGRFGNSRPTSRRAACGLMSQSLPIIFHVVRAGLPCLVLRVSLLVSRCRIFGARARGTCRAFDPRGYPALSPSLEAARDFSCFPPRGTSPPHQQTAGGGAHQQASGHAGRARRRKPPRRHRQSVWAAYAPYIP